MALVGVANAAQATNDELKTKLADLEQNLRSNVSQMAAGIAEHTQAESQLRTVTSELERANADAAA